MQGRFRIAIACAGVLLTTAASAHAQTTYRETGSVTIGGYLVWVRGTNASSVELFVGRGFRDAFARPHDMDAAKLQHWIDSVRTVTPLAAADTTSVDSSARGVAVGTDVTMMRRVGGAHSGLRLMVGGEDPIQMAEPTARDFIVMLDSAARVSLEMSKPGPSLMVGIPAPDVAPAATPAATPAPVIVAVAPVPPPPPPPPPPAPAPAAVIVAPAPPSSPPPPPPTPAPAASVPMIGVPTANTVIGVPPDSIAASEPTPIAAPTSTPASVAAAAAPSAPIGASIADAAPELVLPAPREPVILLASRVEIMPLPAVPIPAPKAAVAEPVVAAPVAAAPTVAAPVPAAPVVATPVASAPVATTSASPIAAPAPDSASLAHIEAPADKLIHTPLGPFTVPGALLADRDKEAQYCYTQLGLKYNPDLKGEITVKLSLASDGTVQDAAVTKRSWQGISAGEVESCVRALAKDWTFASSDATVVDGAKLLTFTFAP